MLRHPALIPLSREHFSALAVASHLLAATAEDNLASLVQEVLALDLESHFVEEELVLVPHLAPAMASQLAEDHAQLRHLLGQLQTSLSDLGLLHTLAELLRSHVRWEERVVFADLTDHLGPAGMAALAEQLRPLPPQAKEAK